MRADPFASRRRATRRSIDAQLSDFEWRPTDRPLVPISADEMRRAFGNRTAAKIGEQAAA